MLLARSDRAPPRRPGPEPRGSRRARAGRRGASERSPRRRRAGWWRSRASAAPAGARRSAPYYSQRHGGAPAPFCAATPAPRLARAPGQRPPLPRHVAARRDPSPGGRLQRAQSRAAARAAVCAAARRSTGSARSSLRTSSPASIRTACREPPVRRAPQHLVREQLAPYGLKVEADRFRADLPGHGQEDARQPGRDCTRPLARRDRRDGASRRRRHRARGEQQRLRDRGADPARALVRLTARRAAGKPDAHVGLRRHRRRRVRRARRAALRRARTVAGSSPRST